MYFEKTYSIAAGDVDCFDCCRASALLTYLQDAAGQAAMAFGASNYQMIEKYRHCWMVVRTHYNLDLPLHMGDALTLKTWHRGGSKPLMYRDFDLSVNGRSAGQALSIWVLVNVADRSISRADRFPEFAGTDGGALIRDTKCPKVKLPTELRFVEERRLHYSDTDPNGHVNNTRYADFLCDAAGLLDAPAGSYVRELYLSYTKECRAGEVLTLLSAREGERRFVLGQDEAGEARFHGYVAL